jgi:hypothetical protein
LNSSQVGMTLGNHDYVRKDDAQGRVADARKGFTDLSSNFIFGKNIKKGLFFDLWENQRGHFLLTLDSTFGEKENFGPSKLATKEIDEVVSCVMDWVPNDNPLIVLSHYPMVLNSRAQYITEEDNWTENHLWKSGTKISERILSSRNSSPTFWLFGDGHVPDFCTYNENHHFLMTGMIGGNFINPTYQNLGGDKIPYNKHNEVKIIGIDGELVSIETISYRSKGNTNDPHLGQWETIPSSIRKEVDLFKTGKLNPEHQTEAQLSIKQDPSTEIISISVQEEILDLIQIKSLYNFNRYLISKDDVSLGWISIYKLFESQELLSRCIEKSIEWLDKKIRADYSDTLLIGVEFWGAILATQVSIRKELQNFCVATKSGGKHYTELEKIDMLCERVKALKNIVQVVIFTDVISTGNTVSLIKQRLQKILPSKTNWILISVITDISQKRNLNEFFAVGTFCGDLRIPILKKNELPDESILPVKFNIS